MDAEAVVGDLLHNNIIDEGDKRDITSARNPRLQNQELHLCLKRKCTPDALMTVCGIMTAVEGNPKMLALGEAIKRKLVTGIYVYIYVYIYIHIYIYIYIHIIYVRVCVCVCVCLMEVLLCTNH